MFGHRYMPEGGLPILLTKEPTTTFTGSQAARKSAEGRILRVTMAGSLVESPRTGGGKTTVYVHSGLSASLKALKGLPQLS